MDFSSYLKTAAAEINREIEIFFQKWREEVASVSPKISALSTAFSQANEGGKRLRGTLVKLGYELAGGSETAEIVKPAAAFEIFNTAILIHDDIIDLSPTRRGRPTLYRTLGGDHYGISQAICLGDAGFFLATQLIAHSNFPDTNKNKALVSFNQTVLDTALGEILDVELPHQGKEKIEDDALTIFRLKTAHYTIVGPLHLGAFLAGANQKLIEEMTKIGESLGIAFQIQDDILGVFGDEATLGKSVTSDIEEGKNTLLIIRALKNANPKQKAILDKYYGQGAVGKEELEQIKKVFTDTGALEYSRKRAFELVDEASKVIDLMEISSDYKDLLCQMADLLIKRDK